MGDFRITTPFQEHVLVDYLFLQATVEVHGYHTRGQLVLEKRNKNLVKSHSPSDANKNANDAKSQRAGIAHVVLSVDVEKLKNCLTQGLSPL